MKRLIGINKDVPDYKYILENFPFKLVEEKGNYCLYHVEENVNIYPLVEITSFIIKRLVVILKNIFRKESKK